MAARKMLTKATEKGLRAGIDEALAKGTMTLQEGQTVGDVIEYVRQGIKKDIFKPGLSFHDFYTTLTGPAEASPGGEVLAQPSEQAPAPEGAIDAAKAEVEEPIDDLVDWLKLYQAAKAKEAESKEKAELARKRITERLGDKTDATIDGQVVATYKWVKSTRFDKTKLEAENPGMVERYTVPNPSRRFELK